MPKPTRQEVYSIFKNLETPNGGTEEFFKSISPDVQYTVPGHGRFAGTNKTKEDWYNALSKFRSVLRPPGFTFCVVNGIDGVVGGGEDGLAAVMLETVDTVTKSGVRYDQHYAWICRFDNDKKVVECRAYLDLGYLEDVLGKEIELQGIE